LDLARGFAPDRPERCRAFVAQDRPVATSQDCRHPLADARELAPADRVHAAMDRVQSADRDSVLDGLEGVPKVEELEERNDAVLGDSQRPGTFGAD
jgi:hypothetical protein